MGHARLRLVGIARNDDELAWVHRHVQGAARQVAATSAPEVDVILDPHPTNVLLETAADSHNVLCFASHHYRRVAAKVMHSVGSSLIARAPHPIVVVGPHAAPSTWATDVVIALDGVGDPRPLLATATAWARQLEAPLRIVTVYEPVPADLNRPSHFTRHHGPSGHPEQYLDAMKRNVEEHGMTSVSTASIADPVSVTGGITDHLASRPARLLVVGRGRHHEDARPAAGALRDLLQAVALPVLVVNQREKT